MAKMFSQCFEVVFWGRAPATISHPRRDMRGGWPSKTCQDKQKDSRGCRLMSEAAGFSRGPRRAHVPCDPQEYPRLPGGTLVSPGSPESPRRVSELLPNTPRSVRATSEQPPKCSRHPRTDKNTTNKVSETPPKCESTVRK